MSFLTPIPMLIAAGLAVPALLALYFLKLRRRPVRVSSTMLWEDAANDLEVNTPWRWIRSSWLLWLHLMILALLLLALGRPTLDTTGARPARVILIIDRSASMNAANTDGKTRLDTAIDRAHQLIDEATSTGTEVAIIAMDTQPVLLGPPSTSRGELRLQLSMITPTDRPSKPQGAFDLAQSLTLRVVNEGDTETPSTVIFLSDGGNTLGKSFSLAGAGFVFERIAEDTPLDNLGVVALSARRDLTEPALVRLFFRLINTGTSEVAVPISIESGSVSGAELERETQTGNQGGTQTLRRFAITVPGATTSGPGEFSRTIELRLTQAESITLRLDRPDALVADNAAGLRIPKPEAPALLLVSSTNPEGVLSPSPLLHDLLAALEPRALRSVSLETYERNALSPGEFDLIVFDRVSPSAPPRRPSLSFGTAPEFLHPEPGPPAVDNVVVISWDRAHPALRDVSLDSLIVSRRVELPEQASSVVERMSVLATGPTHPLMIEYRANGLNHLVVSFSPRDSNWPLQVSFAIFMAQATEHLVPIGAGALGRAYSTAEPLRLRAAPGSQTVSLEGPEPRSARVIGGAANLGVPRLVGLYRTAGATEAEIPVSLLNTGESSLRAADRVGIAGRSVLASQEPELGPTEIWRWLVIAALGLLALDWVLYGLQMRVGRTQAFQHGTI